MLIGELSKKTGLSRDAIRFYEKQGLITVSNADRRTNNYKEYSSEILSKIYLIKDLKDFGFTLNEIKEIISSWTSRTFDCEVEKPRILNRISFIEEKIKQLTAMRNSLVRSIQNCPTDCDIVQSLKYSEKRA